MCLGARRMGGKSSQCNETKLFITFEFQAKLFIYWTNHNAFIYHEEMHVAKIHCFLCRELMYSN